MKRIFNLIKFTWAFARTAWKSQRDLGQIEFTFVLCGGDTGVARQFYGAVSYDQIAFMKSCAPDYFDEIIHDEGICPDCNTHPEMPQA